ncbi:MAG: anti-sigma factor [Leptolyngbya sp. SIO4C1]|nr:anti-sigma factor [Leptolyngbya sp. SIO4C1]
MTDSTPSLDLLLAGYVLNTLSQEEAALLEQYLAADPTLQERIDQLQATLEAAYATPEVKPPPQLRMAILAATEALPSQQTEALPSQQTEALPSQQTEALPSQQEAEPASWARRLPAWQLAFGLAAAIAIAWLGIDNYRLRLAKETAPTEIATETPASESLDYALQPVEADLTAAAQIELNPAELEGELTVAGLPPLPPEQVYVLWTILAPDAPFTADSKGAILTETFNTNAQGNVTESLVLPEAYQTLAQVAAIGITVESADAPQAHQGSPILLTDL